MEGKKNYQICTRCIMDTSDAEIVFDKKGICNHCHTYDQLNQSLGYRYPESDQELDQIVRKIKAHGKGKKYDCVLGISGGVDSAYLAHLASRLGLRVLAIHIDAGWNSKIAVENIKKLCEALKIDLHTVVIDWETMKELQRAYMFSGLVNIDVPQDHAFLAAVYACTKKYHLKYMLNGGNIATEGILPRSWVYDAKDYTNIKSVYQECGRNRISLSKYPHMDLAHYFIYTYLKWPERINLLNYIPYSKKEAMQLLESEYGWKYYGGKHFESIFTRFMQEVYLPEKFGFNKKRAHLSSLVVSGEMSRADALREMEDESGYSKEQRKEDTEYILKKLDISEEEWKKILQSPNKLAEDYKSNQKIMMRLRRIKRKIVRKRKVK